MPTAKAAWVLSQGQSISAARGEQQEGFCRNCSTEVDKAAPLNSAHAAIINLTEELFDDSRVQTMAKAWLVRPVSQRGRAVWFAPIEPYVQEALAVGSCLYLCTAYQISLAMCSVSWKSAG